MQRSKRRQGTRQHGTGLKAGLARYGFILTQHIARNSHRKHTDHRPAGAHDLKADHGIFRLKRQQFLKPETHNRQRLR